MGVFKWLRRERVTVTTGRLSTDAPEVSATMQTSTIRTKEYKRDLAEFQARRSSLSKDEDTPVKKRCGRHSLPVSCTSCTGDPDTTFNYEQNSATKYMKKSRRRAKSAQPQETGCDGNSNIQFLFQNQVFMPGNLFPATSYSEPAKPRRPRHRSPDFLDQRHNVSNDERPISPPLFYKNNSLPFNLKEFLEERSDVEEVDGVDAAGDSKPSSDLSSKSDMRCDDKLWMPMDKLKLFDRWADSQLEEAKNSARSEEIKEDTSTFGLPIASSCNLDFEEKNKVWCNGRWGVVPVQMKKVVGVTVEHVKKKLCVEINILRKCRHPNIILLMGLYPDVHNNVHLICERCVDTLFNLVHIEGRILSAQTAVGYALDVANALVFLRMHGYVHTELNSTALVVTAQRTVKLGDLSACSSVVTKRKRNNTYSIYTPEPQYVNLSDTFKSTTTDCAPLISAQPSELYLASNAVVKQYKVYSESELYQWQAPELFVPDDDGLVRPCSKSDVYSLCIILWECCNASLPWKSMSYGKLKEQYTVTKQGLTLPQDGTYPGSLLCLLQEGLQLDRSQRLDLETMQETLNTIKKNMDEMDYIIIPGRVSKKQNKSNGPAWDTTPTESECQSPKHVAHDAIIHTQTNSQKNETKTNLNPLFETVPNIEVMYSSEKSSTSDDDDFKRTKYKYLHEKNYSSACSTPAHKIKEKVRDMDTTGTFHRSDSTEYCSILSPDIRFTNLALNNRSVRDYDTEPPTAKLSRSFTPQSYKPLHIKVPEFNLESIKNILKTQSNEEKSSYNFDIKNYSLPSTPIARSNKLRKNAWLSGDLGARSVRTSTNNLVEANIKSNKDIQDNKSDSPESDSYLLDRVDQDAVYSNKRLCRNESRSTESMETPRDSFTGLRRIIDPPHDFSSPENEPAPFERTRSLNCVQVATNYKVEDDTLANVNVKPLVAIHEKWIYEANKKTGRSFSLPEHNGSQSHAVKPASHCVDTLQKSLPQLYVRRSSPTKPLRTPSPSNSAKNGPGNTWEHYQQAREAISRSLHLNPIDTRTITRSEKSTITDAVPCVDQKVDRSTDTDSIDVFIKYLIRKEVQTLLGDMSDNASDSSNNHCSSGEEAIDRGVTNIMESLENPDEAEHRRDTVRSFSRIKINGNNKPLVQITFSRTGENSLRVLDNCVNVTLSETASSRDKLNGSPEDAATPDDLHFNSLKRCQAFSAIQEARSTEDLYIDDDLSTQMQENFGGKVKLIPLHGSLHEILCEKEDDCCLLKVKQENGCDTIYFRCDNSDTESRDAVDGRQSRKTDTVVYKRSISLIEERIQRVLPKDKRQSVAALKKLNERLRARPKSEVFKRFNKASRGLSNSSPSLSVREDHSDEVEFNIESVLCYQDSSSEECLRSPADDDFEMLEREIEQDLANHTLLASGCLEKISEENLSVIDDDY